MTTNNQPAQTLASAKGIEITEQALEHIRQAMAKEGMAASEGGLRLGVQGGGCSGMSYSIRFDKQPRQRDRVFQFGEVRVFVDPKVVRLPARHDPGLERDADAPRLRLRQSERPEDLRLRLVVLVRTVSSFKFRSGHSGTQS